MTMDQDRLHQLTMQALDAAFNRNAEAAASALTEIGETGGDSSIYGACCAFAEVGRAALAKFYGDATPDPARGEMWAMQQLGDSADPHDLFAVRFIVAYANQDQDLSMALFNASIEAGGNAHVDSVCALLGTAVQLANSATAQ
ncbi:hypothetical protein AB0F09_19205 [Streptomyces olivaceus]|uniref:hypothetical protein n=1 Tax=Streptomyces olivaceus TaxID=47716 RepID=UPI0033DCC091